MARSLLAALALLCAGTAFAGVDVNQATEAQLDGVKGLGPAMTRRILAERQKGEFRSWSDLVARVPGFGVKNAEKLSQQGLTVNGTPYAPSVRHPRAGGDPGR